MSKVAKIFDIQRSSFVDGPGIRTTVFFKGCNLRCAWCHNPESQSLLTEMMIFTNKCIGCGKCKTVCPNKTEACTFCGKCELLCPKDARCICGKEITVNDLIKIISKDDTYYNCSDGGVTFSGGECMLQIDFLEDILRECSKKHIHTAVDTAGNVPFDYFEKIIPYTDLFLYDVKCFDNDLHKKFTGDSNELILSNLSKLLSKNIPLWIRIPIIPEFNDNEAELIKIRNYIFTHGNPLKIELLPYHKLGEHKYEALNRQTVSFSAPSKECIEFFYSLFK